MPLAVAVFGVTLDNPVTPWVVLGLVAAAWVGAYLAITAGPRA